MNICTHNYLPCYNESCKGGYCENLRIYREYTERELFREGIPTEFIKPKDFEELFNKLKIIPIHNKVEFRLFIQLIQAFVHSWRIDLNDVSRKNEILNSLSDLIDELEHEHISRTSSKSKKKKRTKSTKVKVIKTMNKLPSYKFTSPLKDVKSLNLRITGPTPKPNSYDSSNYTIAPAYNKGPYMVISKENVKDIGK